MTMNDIAVLWQRLAEQAVQHVRAHARVVLMDEAAVRPDECAVPGSAARHGVPPAPAVFGAPSAAASRRGCHPVCL